MLYCNLSGLMAAKRVTISDVSRDTNISRTTLTNLYYNSFKGIQNDTLDTLCKYFNVTVDKLLVFSRYDVDVKIDHLNSGYIFEDKKTDKIGILLTFSVSYGVVCKSVDVWGTVYLYWDDDNISAEAIIGWFEPNDNIDKENIAFVKKALLSLPHEIKKAIENKIASEIINNYQDDVSEYRIIIEGISVELWEEDSDDGKHNPKNE